MNASIKETHNLPINWFRCPNLLAHIGHILFLGTAQPIELVAVFIFTTLNGLEMVKHCTLVAHFHHKHTRLAREQHPGENSETHPSYLSAISVGNPPSEYLLSTAPCSVWNIHLDFRWLLVKSGQHFPDWFGESIIPVNYIHCLACIVFSTQWWSNRRGREDGFFWDIYIPNLALIRILSLQHLT